MNWNANGEVRFRVLLLVGLAVLIMLVTTVALGQSCVDYSNYLRWSGRCWLPGTGTGQSGRAVAIMGSYAFVGETGQLTVVDLLAEPNPEVVGEYGGLPSYIEDITVWGNYAYVIVYDNGLYTFNVTDPVNPLLENVDYAGGRNHRIHCDGSCVYVLAYYTLQQKNYLRVFDIANPADPLQIYGDWTDGFTVNGSAMDRDRDLIYLGCKGRVVVIGVSDPYAPFTAGTVTLDESEAFATGVAVVNDILFVTEFGYLLAYDVTDPESPLPLCDTQFSEAYAVDMALAGGALAYIVTNQGLTVVNVESVSSPTEPSMEWWGSIEVVGDTEIADVAVYFSAKGPLLGVVVTSVDSGLHVVGGYWHWSPPAFGRYPTQDANDVHVVNDTAYVADGVEGLVVVDVINPYSPGFVSSADVDYTCNGVDVEGNYAYVSAGTPGHGWLVVIDISDRESPAPIDTIQFVGTGASDVEVMGGYAYLPGRYHFYVVDVSDPTNPFIAKDLYTGIQETQNVKLFGDYAYYAYREGMVIVDISDPPNAFVVGTYHTVDTSVGAVGVDTAYAFLSHEYGLMAINVSDPSSPTWAGDFPLPERGVRYASDMVVTDDTVHVTMATAGIYVIDVSDIDNMQLIGASDPMGEYAPGMGYGMAGGLHLTDEIAYFADGRSGLQIVAAHCTDHHLAGVPSQNDASAGPDFIYNAPNPFSGTTTITYDLPAPGRVKLEVFDVTGRRVNVLVDEHRPAGPGSAIWDGTNSQGTAVPAGIYFSRLTAGDRKMSMKMLRLK